MRAEEAEYLEECPPEADTSATFGRWSESETHDRSLGGQHGRIRALRGGIW